MVNEPYNGRFNDDVVKYMLELAKLVKKSRYQPMKGKVF